MSLLRLLKVLLRGLRPISHSLHSISSDLHVIRRVAEMRLRLEHNEVLPREDLLSDPRKLKPEDQTELTWAVKEPEINPETGKPMVEDDEWKVDLSAFFRK